MEKIHNLYTLLVLLGGDIKNDEMSKIYDAQEM